MLWRCMAIYGDLWDFWVVAKQQRKKNKSAGDVLQKRKRKRPPKGANVEDVGDWLPGAVWGCLGLFGHCLGAVSISFNFVIQEPPLLS